MGFFSKEDPRVEQSVRAILDSGELYSETEIRQQLPNIRSEEITASLIKLITGGKLYTIQSGKYGRKPGT